MSRSGLDNNRTRGMVLETAILNVPEILAISANFVWGIGGPYAVVLDPASTNRNVTLYTPTVTALMHEHELFNISAGTGNLVVKDPTGATTLATLRPGERAIVRYVNSTVGWLVFKGISGSQAATTAAKSTLSLYTTLAGLVNTNVLAVNVPFAFALLAMRFRPRTPATTAAKLATLTAGIASTGTGALTPVTGGVLALTSANMTPTDTPVASTAITALNTGPAGSAIGATVSSVTAFVEGDGYLEFDVTNTDLVA